MLTAVLVEANLNLSADFNILDLFSSKAIINYLFPKDPHIQRVRYENEIQTEVNNVTTLDFVSISKLSFNILPH